MAWLPVEPFLWGALLGCVFLSGENGPEGTTARAGVMGLNSPVSWGLAGQAGAVSSSRDQGGSFGGQGGRCFEGWEGRGGGHARRQVSWASPGTCGVGPLLLPL
jgi:hypothetical protein